MKAFLKFLTLLICIICLAMSSRSNNIMASDVSWRCVGQDSFLIKVVVYRDCNGDALLPVDLNIRCLNTGSLISVIKLQPVTPVDVTPACNVSCTRCSDATCSFPYGINKYTMQVIINLSNSGACCRIKLSWQQCCRNISITTGAAGKNFYTEAIMNRCQNPCDNSPTLYQIPIGILCIGTEYQFHIDPQDIDIDGSGNLIDSFSFKFAPPLQASGDSIGYSGLYSSTKPLYFDGFPANNSEFPKGFHIVKENSCAILQFKPMKAEISVFSIIISEYRKGLLIGEIRRELQYIVIQCPTNHQPVINTQNNIRAKEVTDGDQVVFNFSTNDSDINDTLTISWNNAIPGAYWTHNNGEAKHPVGTLTWTPQLVHASNMPYNFTVTVRDDAHPVRASFTQVYQIKVRAHPKAKIIISDSCNGLFYFFAEKIEGSSPVYTWIGNNFIFSPKIGPLTSHKFQPGIYPYTMTMVAGGSSATYFDTLVYFPIKATLPNDTAVCKNAKMHLKLNLDPFPYNYFVEWSSGSYIFNHDTNTYFTISVTGDTTIIANVYTSPSCWVSSDTIHIKLLNCTSINDQVTPGHIKMNPNPASDKVSISTDIPAMKFQTISIYNNLGILVKQYNNIGTNSITVYRDFANSGLYFVNVLFMNGYIINSKLMWK
jgi:hypothetical protein